MKPEGLGWRVVVEEARKTICKLKGRWLFALGGGSS